MIHCVSDRASRDASMLQERCDRDTWYAYECTTLCRAELPGLLITSLAGTSQTATGMRNGGSWRVGPWHVLCCDVATADGAAAGPKARDVSPNRSLTTTFIESIKAPKLAQLVHEAQPLWQ